MSDAIIARRSGGSSIKIEKVLKTEIIFENTNWVVPRSDNQKFDVRIFGGGGGGAAFQSTAGCGGGGGWMNNDIFTLNKGDIVDITIGSGGGGASYWSQGPGSAGGVTSFGLYLSANGGSGGQMTIGGDGGSGGGTPEGWEDVGAPSDQNNVMRGGRGYQFGDGGGTTLGLGGPYGGNGASWSVVAQNGIDTSTWTNIPEEYRRVALGGGAGGGGGGYGCNGGSGTWRKSEYSWSGKGKFHVAGGGGGGYFTDGSGAGSGGAGYGNYAHGGAGSRVPYSGDVAPSGSSGVCIIQYYSLEVY